MNEKLISEYKKIHNNKYDYSKFIYKNARTKSIIICPIHGDFKQLPNSHKVSGCRECSLTLRSGGKSFIIKSNIIHDNFYNYDKSDYIRNSTKIIITCPIHGDFCIIPKNHLNGQGCKRCHIDRLTHSRNDFISRVSKIHSDKYDYDKFVYRGMKYESIIICPIHGDFIQRANNHCNMTQGCNLCKIDESRMTWENFVDKSMKTHGKYIYPEQEFNFNNKVLIECPLHGTFKQLPNNHCNLGHGCRLCNDSRGERFIYNLLIDENIYHVREKKFNGCRYKKELLFDFYLPNYNICIEYQGIQHYKSVEYMGGESVYKSQIIRDDIKRKFCINENIQLIVIPYTYSENEIKSCIMDCIL